MEQKIVGAAITAAATHASVANDQIKAQKKSINNY